MLYPWRFQADVSKNDLDPMVTVFTGPQRQVMAPDGTPTSDTFIDQTTANPVSVPLSELPGVLADPSKLTEMVTKDRR